MIPLTLTCLLLIAQDAEPSAESFVQELAGTTLSIELLPIEGGPLPREDGPVEIAPLFVARHETTWDLYDVFVYGYDLPRAAERTGGQADGVTRPTRPYIAADHGFGHAGYPALSISHNGAEAFCAWLRHKTGRNYRLPTEQEWEWATRAGAAEPWARGEEQLGEYAWVRDNARRKTHPVGEKLPNPWGLHDVLGNVAEWCTTDEGGHVLRGGAYLDRAETVDWSARREPTPAWNANDPQIPKSIWWLTDGSFAGFRIVCDRDGDQPVAAPVPESPASPESDE